MDGKLRFIELDDEKVKCPLCDFTALRFERKKVYNHAFKKHKGLIYTKLSVRSNVTAEEKKAKSKMLSYERVKKFRLLKKLRSLADDGKAHNNQDDLSFQERSFNHNNNINEIHRSDINITYPRITDNMNILSYFESVASNDRTSSYPKMVEEAVHDKPPTEFLGYRNNFNNINSVFHRLNILHQRVTQSSTAQML